MFDACLHVQGVVGHLQQVWSFQTDAVMLWTGEGDVADWV
jgi:hypothetical protein